LEKYYDKVWEDTTVPLYESPGFHPRLFPYPTKFKDFYTSVTPGPECTEFEYIDAFSADTANVTFLAKVKSPDQKLVIKFVDWYGAEAHELLARNGLAPRLLYCGLLDGTQDFRITDGHPQGSAKVCGLHVGPMRMVVMDFIEGKTVEKMSPVPSDAREKTLKAIKKLHDAQLVFGDLRAPNVMISEGKVFLIDFDWAGRVGQARYPRNLSRSVNWPAKAEDLEMMPILMDHDLTMLDSSFPSTERLSSHP
jgi:serine/threonine protein kinase